SGHLEQAGGAEIGGGVRAGAGDRHRGVLEGGHAQGLHVLGAVAEGDRGAAGHRAHGPRLGALGGALGRGGIRLWHVDEKHVIRLDLDLGRRGAHLVRPGGGVTGEGADRPQDAADRRGRADDQQQHEPDEQRQKPAPTPTGCGLGAARARQRAGERLVGVLSRALRGLRRPALPARRRAVRGLAVRGGAVGRGSVRGGAVRLGAVGAALGGSGVGRAARRRGTVPAVAAGSGGGGPGEPVAGTGASGWWRGLTVGHQVSFAGRSGGGSTQRSRRSSEAPVRAAGTGQVATTSSMTPSSAAPSTAVASGVLSQTRTMAPATRQRTFRRPLAAPAPTTLEASAWEVETGEPIPNRPSDMVAAAETSAASPWATVRSVR